MHSHRLHLSSNFPEGLDKLFFIVIMSIIFPLLMNMALNLDREFIVCYFQLTDFPPELIHLRFIVIFKMRFSLSSLDLFFIKAVSELRL